MQEPKIQELSTYVQQRHQVTGGHDLLENTNKMNRLAPVFLFCFWHPIFHNQNHRMDHVGRDL